MVDDTFLFRDFFFLFLTYCNDPDVSWCHGHALILRVQCLISEFINKHKKRKEKKAFEININLIVGKITVRHKCERN